MGSGDIIIITMIIEVFVKRKILSVESTYTRARAHTHTHITHIKHTRQTHTHTHTENLRHALCTREGKKYFLQNTDTLGKRI